MRWLPLLRMELPIRSAPIVMMAVMGLSIIFLILQKPTADPAAKIGAIWCAILLFLGAGVLLPGLMHRASGNREIGVKNTSALIGAGCVTALVWIGEICGRVSFYKEYTWFGM